MNLPKKLLSILSFPLPSVLYVLAVERFFKRSLSSLLSSKTSSTAITNFEAQSELNLLLKSSLLLMVL